MCPQPCAPCWAAPGGCSRARPGALATRWPGWLPGTTRTEPGAGSRVGGSSFRTRQQVQNLVLLLPSPKAGLRPLAQILEHRGPMAPGGRPRIRLSPCKLTASTRRPMPLPAWFLCPWSDLLSSPCLLLRRNARSKPHHIAGKGHKRLVASDALVCRGGPSRDSRPSRPASGERALYGQHEMALASQEAQFPQATQTLNGTSLTRSPSLGPSGSQNCPCSPPT